MIFINPPIAKIIAIINENNVTICHTLIRLYAIANSISFNNFQVPMSSMPRQTCTKNIEARSDIHEKNSDMENSIIEEIIQHLAVNEAS